MAAELRELERVRGLCLGKVRVGGGNINANIRGCLDNTLQGPFRYSPDVTFVLGERSVQHICKRVEERVAPYMDATLSDEQLRQLMELEFE